MDYHTLLSHLDGVRAAPARDGLVAAHRALCPCHQTPPHRPGRSPSLSLAQRDDGAVLLHCHAGCAPDEIAGALGIRLADLFPHSGAGKSCDTWIPVAALLDEAASRILLAALQDNPLAQAERLRDISRLIKKQARRGYKK